MSSIPATERGIFWTGTVPWRRAEELYEATKSQDYLEACRRFFGELERSAIARRNGIWFLSRQGELYFILLTRVPPDYNEEYGKPGTG